MKRATSPRARNLMLIVIALVAITIRPEAGSQKFYPDDPLLVNVEDQDASRARPREANHAFNSWQAIRGVGDRSSRQAMNVNSVEEVPEANPVRTYFRKDIGDTWTLVGFERLQPGQEEAPCLSNA